MSSDPPGCRRVSNFSSGWIIRLVTHSGMGKLVHGPRHEVVWEVKEMAAGKKAKNMAQKAKGKMKETTGDAVGNESLEAKGTREQIAGDAKQTGQKAKDTLKH